MKRVVFSFIVALFLVSFASSLAIETCAPTATLLNQDPYPAVPGEYVKLVFQIDGISSTSCGQITTEFIPEYPFLLDPNVSSKVSVKSGTFISQTYQSYLLAPFQVRVDKDALDKEYTAKIKVGSSEIAENEFRFNVKVEEVRTDFEVSIQDYDAATSTVTFGILNMGKKNAEALTLEIPKQSTIDLLGANKQIIGSLDSNDDTTVSFKAIPKTGEIAIKLSYNDAIGERRTLDKIIVFSDGYLKAQPKAEKGAYYYAFWILLAIVIIYLIYAYYRRKKILSKNKLLLRSRQ